MPIRSRHTDYHLTFISLTLTVFQYTTLLHSLSFTMNLTLAIATFATIIVIALANTDTITDRSHTDGTSTTVFFAHHAATHGNNVNDKDLTFNPLCLMCRSLCHGASCKYCSIICGGSLKPSEDYDH